MAQMKENGEVPDYELMLREAVDKSPNGIIFVENERIIECNPSALSLLEYNSVHELRGKLLKDIFPFLQEEAANSAEKTKNVLELCLERGSYKSEIQYRLKNGNIILCDLVLTAIQIHNRSVIYCVLKDVSENKKIHVELREREEMFRIAFEDAPSGMSIIAPNDFSYIAVNPLLCKMFGYTRDELMNKNIHLVTHPEDEEKSNEWIRRKYNDLPCEPFIEKRYIHRDGHVVWGLVSAEWIKNEDGSKRMAITHILDITQIKLAEQELIEHRNHLEKLVDERTKELLLSNEELHSINEELSRQRMRLEEALKELKTTQEQLIESEKMASLGILTAGVAHEINNPLNYIFNGTAAIEASLTEENQGLKTQLKPFFDAINLGITRVNDIVKSLGKYSRSEDYPSTECNINEILDNCLSMLLNQYKNRIEIIKEYSPTLPRVLANEGQLHQAFLNVLVNSVQAIHNKGKIVISTGISKKGVTVKISDTGIGISAENLKRIFDPFFTTKDPNKGTGLGLSITHKIILQHQGTISCESELKKGTKIIIYLPLRLSYEK
jgi:PAS domain S-box-containing protein